MIALGLAGILFHAWVTQAGIGVLHDSVFYLETAKNLAQGKGLVWTGAGGDLRPLTHFPPGYSLILTPFVTLGIDPVTVARTHASVLFGLNVALIGLAVWRSIRRAIPSILAMIVAALSPAFFGVHLMAMSEPQYLACHLISLILLIEYLGNRKREFLIGSASAAALAALTRYVGLATPIAGLAILMLLGRTTTERKLTDLAVFGSISLAPSVLLAIRNNLASGAITNRILILNAIDYLRRRQAQDVVSQWLLPERFPYSVRVRIAAILITLIMGLVAWATITVVRGAGKRQSGPANRPMSMAWAMILYAGIYSGVLVSSAMLFDASTRWDDRILIPIFQSMVVITVISISYLTTEPSKGRLVATAGLIGAAGLAMTYLPQTAATTETMRTEGIGFSGSGWRNSDAVRWARQLPSSTVIYSNEGLALIFLTDLEPFFAPERINPVTGEERQDLGIELQRMRDRLKAGGYLILFHPENLRTEMPPLGTLTEGLSVYRQLNDAIIYVGG